ncbi:MAG: hypothetical protein ACTHN0_17335, partial [Aquihabitans sp.]
MAATMAERETDGEAKLDVDEDGYLRRVRRSSIVIVAGILLVAALVVGRWAVSAQARSQVEVSLGDRPMVCADAANGDPGMTPGGKALVRADMS